MADNMMRIAGRGLDGTAKPIKTDNEGNVGVDAKPISNKSRFEYTQLAYTVIGVYGNVLYGMDAIQRNLYKSVDNGVTWGSVLFSPPESFIIQSAHLTSAGVFLAFCSDGKVYRSADGVTFTAVLSGIGTPMPHGVSSNGAVICFGEYYNQNGTTVSIRRSADGGLTWSNVLDLFGTSGVAHWHSCQYMPNIDKWIATTGDGPGILWYQSDNGTTWINIINTTMMPEVEQFYRTLNVHAPSVNRLVWSSDGTPGYEGVYSQEYFNRNALRGPLERDFLLPHVSYAFAAHRNLYIATTMITSVSSYLGKQNPSVIVSLDQGVTWRLDKELSPAITGTERGFFAILGPDAKGSFYLWCKNTELGVHSTLKCSPSAIVVDNLKSSDPASKYVSREVVSLGTFIIPAGTTKVILVRDWTRYRKGTIYVSKTSGSKALSGSIYAQWCDTLSVTSGAYGALLPFDVDTSLSPTRGLLYADVKMPFIKVTVNNTASADDMTIVVKEKLQV